MQCVWGLYAYGYIGYREADTERLLHMGQLRWPRRKVSKVEA